MAKYFGIRHLSAASSLHLHTFLEEMKPAYILIEGPSDCNDMLSDIVHKELIPPFAIMAYTTTAPIQSILYPFATYSPEYQAIQWAYTHQVPCAFFDVPTSLYFERKEEATSSHQRQLELDLDQNDVWEKEFEQGISMEDFQRGIQELGRQLRLSKEEEEEETRIREAYMKGKLEALIASGIPSDQIAIVCGAYHVEGIQQSVPYQEDADVTTAYPQTQTTLMPYSYLRLSSLSGYGAGNAAPAYFELLWNYGKRNALQQASYEYLSGIASYQRDHGFDCSTAEVIEAVQLSQSLASLQGKRWPTLQDLKDAAITCLGHGSSSELMEAMMMNNIGLTMGSLPDGMSKTAIQNDVTLQLKRLHLERFKTINKQELVLDLRENTSVKSEEAAFLDLHRSNFLHQLRVLQIPFVHLKEGAKDQSSWKEVWELQWSSEAELRIIEQSLFGETISFAASFFLKTKLEEASDLADCAGWMQEAFLCGLADSMTHAQRTLQALSIASIAFVEIVHTLQYISQMLRYGSIRRMEVDALEPLFHQLFYRSILLSEEACGCDDKQANDMVHALGRINEISLQHDSYMEKEWLQVVQRIAKTDHLHPLTCGYASAMLLERGKLLETDLQQMLSSRLSYGTPCAIGAVWFEGLMMKNHYALIARSHVWKQLDDYLQHLSTEQFHYALVYLRRAFATYSAKEKYEISMNLGAIWNLDQDSVAESIQTELKEEEQQMLKELEAFDFGDF